jgi:phage tail sheath protein FI
MKKNITWFSTAGPNRGLLSNDILGCPYNLLSPALKDDYDAIYEKGINAVGIHKTFGAVYWGNRSLLLRQESVLKFDNVADLAMYVRDNLLALVQAFNFEPNDLFMFSGVYNIIKPFAEGLETGRAIHPDKWEWIGDQFASKTEDLKYNTIDDVQQGRFKARFRFAPIVANEIIEIEVGVSDLGAFAEIVA